MHGDETLIFPISILLNLSPTFSSSASAAMASGVQDMADGERGDGDGASCCKGEAGRAATGDEAMLLLM